MKRRHVAAGFGLVLAAGCGGASGKPAATTGATKSTVEQLFPLVDGHLYSYATTDGSDTGMLTAKVKRTDATHGQLQLAGTTNRFVYRDDGVAYETGVYVLKLPIAVGTTWAGEHGGVTRIGAVDSEVVVPAGHYAGCVRTDEEGGGLPPGKRFETTFCPGIGIALLVVKAPVGEGRAELKYYGAPVVISP